MNISKNADPNSVFLDTNFLIYFLEDTNYYKNEIKAIINDITEKNYSLYISTITEMEYLVGLYKKTKANKVYSAIKSFYSAIDDVGMSVISIDSSIANTSAKLRAEYGFKQMDSIQLGTAIELGCKYFITNDFELKRCNEINVICIENYSNDLL